MSTNRQIQQHKPATSEVRLISANIRGFHTNVGDLTYQFVTKNKADVVFVVETFLDDTVPDNYARITGFTKWYRKDRNTQGGGVALCYKENLQIQIIDTSTPPGIEIIIFKIIDSDGRGTLCCGCYRPPSQGTQLLDFLSDNLDRLLMDNNCHKIFVFGDLNQRRIQEPFDQLLAMYNLSNFVNFPTHSSGSSLDPVITDLPHHTVRCSPLGFVGTSDHVAVLTKINFRMPREESSQRTIWKWEAADWTGLQRTLSDVDWDGILQEDINQQVHSFTTEVLDAQYRFVPRSVYSSRPSDQPWFGPQCKIASDNKYCAWLRYKHRPTTRNKKLHKEAKTRMHHVARWAMQRWKNNIKKKLKDGKIGSKQWWNIVKDKQGQSRDETIPPLSLTNGDVALSTTDKINALAEHFATKMTVPHPHQQNPKMPVLCLDKIYKVKTTEGEVHSILRGLDDKKATGPDGISTRLLRRCARELTPPLTTIFNACLEQQEWPREWKISSVVPIHKKGNKSEVKNYRPVSLLSVVSKVLEKIIATRLTHHLLANHLLSSRQFGFKKGYSAADLHLLLTTNWTTALDQGKKTCVFALDIEGAFDRVWHAGLVEKLRAAGVEGELLSLLSNYLHNRQLKVVLNGKESSLYTINAGVPQGSVLGPLLWNIFINDLLHIIPEAHAFADDGTLAVSYYPADEEATVSLLNTRLSDIAAWGEKWQVKFAPHKTQFMIISRTENNLQFNFNGNEIKPQDEIEILGVLYDRKLTFKRHIENIARKASTKIASLRKIAWFLDRNGKEFLYKSQIRSVMEYSFLSWGGAAKTHLALLDKVQRRAVRLIEDGATGPLHTNLDPLQHRRDVAGLTTFFKVHHEHTSHLQPLRQQQRLAVRTTRTVERAPAALMEPQHNTSHYQRQFIYRYCKLWNAYLCVDNDLANNTVQSFKCKVNSWLLNNVIDDM